MLRILSSRQQLTCHQKQNYLFCTLKWATDTELLSSLSEPTVVKGGWFDMVNASRIAQARSLASPGNVNKGAASCVEWHIVD